MFKLILARKALFKFYIPDSIRHFKKRLLMTFELIAEDKLLGAVQDKYTSHPRKAIKN